MFRDVAQCCALFRNISQKVIRLMKMQLSGFAGKGDKGDKGDKGYKVSETV